jgi:2-polyprenyl-3-methyl-5-hydroxy-6-metoxy-1,4-benzoquinol methylase
MEAVEYLKHWKPVNKNRLLRCKKHQKRFRDCVGYIIGTDYIDVGCAEGHSTNIMKGMKPGNWTGIDFCPRTINSAIIQFPHIKFKYIDKIENLHRAGKFDSVICSEVIEHVENDRLMIDKLIEITRNVLIMTTPSVGVKSVGHLRLYNKTSLRELFSKYPETEIIEESPFFYMIYRRNHAGD